MTQSKAAEALVSGNISEAKAGMAQGEKLAGPFLQNNLGQVFRNIFSTKAFDIIDNLIKEGIVETDIYELDDFDHSIFRYISQDLGTDVESIDFLQSFMQKVSNINDEVKDQTLLGFCLESGADIAIIKCLVDAGCDVNYKNNYDQNFVFQVVNRNMMSPEKAAAYLGFLLAEGVDSNAKNVAGTTPLMVAVQKHQLDYINILVQNGADANEQDKNGNTAFYYAVAEQMDKEIYDLLSGYTSPNFELLNDQGQNLFSEYLRMMDGNESEIQLLEKMISDGADLKQEVAYYGTPKSGIEWVIEKTPAILQRMLEIGAVDVNAQDNSGNTPLHQVCTFNVNFSADEAKNTYRKVKMLLEAGAERGITNDNDETPLMLASQDNLKIKTVELLMQKN